MVIVGKWLSRQTVILECVSSILIFHPTFCRLTGRTLGYEPSGEGSNPSEKSYASVVKLVKALRLDRRVSRFEFWQRYICDHDVTGKRVMLKP
jgi:hypothetical protein